MIPLSFILGFYVSFTATRWWNQYTAIPWPDKLMNNIAMYVPGSDETSRMLRRTLMRYLNLTLVLVLRSISIAVKRRFPTKEHLVEAGFMTKLELEMHTSVPSNEFNTFWIPCTWFINLLREARQECRITDSSGLKLIMEEFNEFRSKCGLLWSYDWVSIPLVYTQVVTIATYAFFTASVFGRQKIERSPKVFNVEIEHRYEPYIPVFTVLQFLLYMGLLKLGEQLINPFGDDDEDFELNWIIDRHLKVSILGVDTLNCSPPPMTKDCYWDELDIKLPYTAAAVSYKKRTYRGSMASYHVPSEQQGLVVPEFEAEEDYESEGISDTLSKKDKSSSSIFGSVFSAKSIKRNESLMTLGSEDFEANYPEVWRGSSASFFVTNEEVIYEENGKSSIVKPNGAEANARKSSGEQINQEFQRIRGDSTYFIRSQPRKRSDPLSVLLVSSGSEDKSSDPLLAFAGHTPRPDITFDPTLGVFSNKNRLESAPPSRRPSASSLVKQSKEIKVQAARPPLPEITPAMLDSRLTEVSVARSASSASRKISKSGRSGLLKMGKGEPGLRIRPFVKSKVTFSEDTKAEFSTKDSASLYHLDPRFQPDPMNGQIDLTLSTPELSQRSTDNTSCGGYLDKRLSDCSSSRPVAMLAHPVMQKATLVDTSHVVMSQATVCAGAPPLIGSASGSSTSIRGVRRISCDDVNKNGYTRPDTEETQVWLRHQSLPNIQEITEEGATSPGPDCGEREFGLVRGPSKRHKETTGERVLGKMLSRQSEVEEDIDQPPENTGTEISDINSKDESLVRLSYRADEFSPDPASNYSKSTPPKEGGGNGSSESCKIQTNVGCGGNDIANSRRPRKRAAIRPSNSNSSKQSSTESESGSYATACSLFTPISEEEAARQKLDNNGANKLSFHSTDSSISSFSSAKDQDQDTDMLMPISPSNSFSMTNRMSSDSAIYGSHLDQNLPEIVILPTSPAESTIDIVRANEDNQS
ncbi:uncharacterized protein LOC107362670 isoform X2 [Tetranychus urticae]|nr:uncharacterized protein LOC107362670 isoform X2 [Tetranychus urticae]XP_025016741.1 uncharacterized protein LOC107362670 isoform X2 [Tetranychus urticae]